MEKKTYENSVLNVFISFPLTEKNSFSGLYGHVNKAFLDIQGAEFTLAHPKVPQGIPVVEMSDMVPVYHESGDTAHYTFKFESRRPFSDQEKHRLYGLVEDAGRAKEIPGFAVEKVTVIDAFIVEQMSEFTPEGAPALQKAA